MLRSLGRQTGAEVETEALIDIGARVTNIVVHSAGVPRFVRILLMGGQDVTDAVSEQLGVPLAQAEAIKQQLGRAGMAEGRRTSPAPWRPPRRTSSTRSAARSTTTRPRTRRGRSSGSSSPAGGRASTASLDRLAAATRVPVVAGDPMGSLRVGRTGLEDDQLDFVTPLAAVPVGLALGAIR